MKKWTKWLSFALCLMLLCSALTACSKPAEKKDAPKQDKETAAEEKQDEKKDEAKEEKKDEKKDEAKDEEKKDEAKDDKKEEAKEDKKADGEQITLHFLHKWPNPDYNFFFEDIVKKYMELHPNVKIEMEAAGDEPIKDKLKIVMGTDKQPDVFFSWSGEFAKNYIRSGNALDLTPYLEKNKEWKDDFMMAGLEPFMNDGKYYGIPYRINGKFFVYNKKMFEDNGCKAPETWKEFMEVCETLKGKAPAAPIGLGNIYPWAACHYITGLNQKCVPQDVRMKDYTASEGEYTDPGYIRALNYLKEIEDKGYFQEGVNSTEHNMSLEMFYGGQVAMVYIELEEFQDVQEKMGDNWGFFPLPAIEGEPGNQTFLTGAPDGFMVSAKSQHPDEAVDFLTFLTCKENATAMVKALQWPSPVIGAVNKDNSFPKLVEGLQAIEKAEGMALWLDTDIDIRISDVYLPALQELLNDDKSPEEVMKEVQEIAATVREESK